MPSGIRLKSKSKYSVSLYELIKSYSNHIMRKNFLSINIPKLPLCTTEQAIEIIKKNINSLNEWKRVVEFIPSRFKKTKQLKKTGIVGLFSASLELTKEGLISILQKESFQEILIKQRK
jgi:segregation and condensation protein A